MVKVPEKERVVKVDAVKPSETLPERPDSDGISGEFVSNKGRLPWPVDKGTVVSRFGANSHPVLSNITTQNSGVDISTYKGAHARAVYEGVVQGVIAVPGGSKAVMVRHGSYYSVYTNLSSVSVSKDDVVKRGQSFRNYLHKWRWRNSYELPSLEWNNETKSCNFSLQECNKIIIYLH